MHCNQNFQNLLTVCRKAGKLALGYEPALECLRQKTAQLVLLCSDLSAKTEKEIRFSCGKSGILVQKLDLTMAQIGLLTGRKAGVLTVCDAGFSRGLLQRLEQDDNRL